MLLLLIEGLPSRLNCSNHEHLVKPQLDDFELHFLDMSKTIVVEGLSSREENVSARHTRDKRTHTCVACSFVDEEAASPNFRERPGADDIPQVNEIGPHLHLSIRLSIQSRVRPSVRLIRSVARR